MFLQCTECSETFEGASAPHLLGIHLEVRHNYLTTFVCGQGGCKKRFLAKSSMIRHLSSYHVDLRAPGSCSSISSENQAVNASLHRSEVQPSTSDVLALNDDDLRGIFINADDDVPVFPSCTEMSIQEQVIEAGAQLLVDVRASSSLTGAAVKRFEDGCTSMLQKYSAAVIRGISEKLKDKGLSNEDISCVVEDIAVGNPFKNLGSTEEQLLYFNKKFGVPIPEPKFLDVRVDKRLNPKTNTYAHTQVNESFQYISVEKTIKVILSNKKRREMISKDRRSTDGILRSFLDGSNHRNQHLVNELHKIIVHILLYYDELEIANSLGSKTIIHKLGAFFYQILNLPAALSSKLSTINLLALTHADDMKKEGAFNKVFFPFVEEMKKLSKGVPVNYDGQEFTLCVECPAFTADTVAAHDALGFLGVGANYFCRQCKVHRKDVRANANARGVPRSKQDHQEDLRKVAERKSFSKQCGVKRSCLLDEIPNFSSVENSIFDAFHDLLEGIVPFIIKLVLHHFIARKERFSVNDLNVKIASFDYGIPDKRNKPCPNFTLNMLLDKTPKLKQTGSQLWCLCRVLPFFLAQYAEEDDQYMELIFLLQDISQIVFAFEVSQEDVDHLDNLIFDLNRLFEDLFIKPELVVDEDDDDEEECEEDEMEEEESEGEVDDPGVEGAQEPAAKRRKRSRLKVHIINRLHHLKHYPGMILKFGPAVRMWCAKFEGRLKIFRQHAAICGNFINPPKTMADMFQLSNLKSLLGDDDPEDPNIDHLHAWPCKFRDSLHCHLLAKLMVFADEEILLYTRSATFYGEEYGISLFVCLPGSTNYRPLFGCISHVIVAKEKSKLILIATPWRSLGRSQKYNTFHLVPEIEENAEPVAVEVLSLANFRPMAPWQGADNEIHLSLRTILV